MGGFPKFLLRASRHWWGSPLHEKFYHRGWWQQRNDQCKAKFEMLNVLHETWQSASQQPQLLPRGCLLSDHSNDCCNHWIVSMIKAAVDGVSLDEWGERWSLVDYQICWKRSWRSLATWECHHHADLNEEGSQDSRCVPNCWCRNQPVWYLTCVEQKLLIPSGRALGWHYWIKFGNGNLSGWLLEGIPYCLDEEGNLQDKLDPLVGV